MNHDKHIFYNSIQHDIALYQWSVMISRGSSIVGAKSLPHKDVLTSCEAELTFGLVSPGFLIRNVASKGSPLNDGLVALEKLILSDKYKCLKQGHITLGSFSLCFKAVHGIPQVLNFQQEDINTFEEKLRTSEQKCCTLLVNRSFVHSSSAE